MKFSFFMMPIHQPSENPTLAFQRDISMIHLADELDYDEFFIGEHHSGGWETMPVPEMALSMAAAKAHRIRLGTSVVNLPFHHPFNVAERIAFLDHLTRGRAILGIGPSSLITDINLFEMERDELYPRMVESAEIIVKLLESDEPVSHHGRFWSFNDLRLQLKSYQQPRLPLAIASASGSDTVTDLAARHGMILMSAAGGDLAGVWRKVEEAAKRHGRIASRDNWRIASSFYLAETREEAWADVSAGILREAEYFCRVGLKFLWESYPGQPMHEMTPQSIAETRNMVIGTPDDAIEWIERKVEETGGMGGIMQTTHEWTDTSRIRRSLELFARYVMPRFRGYGRTMSDEWSRVKEYLPEDGSALMANAKPLRAAGE